MTGHHVYWAYTTIACTESGLGIPMGYSRHPNSFLVCCILGYWIIIFVCFFLRCFSQVLWCWVLPALLSIKLNFTVAHCLCWFPCHLDFYCVEPQIDMLGAGLSLSYIACILEWNACTLKRHEQLVIIGLLLRHQNFCYYFTGTLRQGREMHTQQNTLHIPVAILDDSPINAIQNTLTSTLKYQIILLLTSSESSKLSLCVGCLEQQHYPDFCNKVDIYKASRGVPKYLKETQKYNKICLW